MNAYDKTVARVFAAVVVAMAVGLLVAEWVCA